MPMRRMSRPLSTGRIASAASANPAAAASGGPFARGAQAVAGVADDRRGGRQECLGRPADERAAGAHAVTARGDPQEVAGQDRGHQAGGKAQRCGRGIGQERRADHRDDQTEDRRASHSGRTRPRRLRR